MKEFPVLTTKRLLLNQLQESDISEIVHLLNEPEYAKHTLTMPYPYLAKNAKFWLGLAQKGFEQKDKYIFAIRLKDEPKIIGGIDLGINLLHNKAELGYWIGKPYWGQGYMTEAGKAVVEFGFDLGLKKIFASHFSTNPASGRVMLKLGMQKEGVLKCHTKKGDTYQDHVLYAIINETM